jgi:hypothetical protein
LTPRLLVCGLALAMISGCGARPAKPVAASASDAAEREQSGQSQGKRGRSQRDDTVAASADISLKPEQVFALIRTNYMFGIQHCYQTRLKKDPAARGMVTVSFTITERGHTKNGAASGFAKEVDRCIAAKMRRWKFPIPTDPAGEPVQLSFMTTFNLVPN